MSSNIGIGAHPLQLDRPELQYETLETWHSDLSWAEQLRLGRERHEQGILAQTSNEFNEALEATMQGLRKA